MKIVLRHPGDAAGEGQEPAPPRHRARPDMYPRTYHAAAENDDRDHERSDVFDPALKQFRCAFRLSDPALRDYDLRREWHSLRRQVTDHLLGLIAGSRWHEHLVLRGSLLLKAWLGDDAREPGDIDWVFRPADVASHDPLARELFDDLLAMAAARPAAGQAVIDVSAIAIDDIWTYERASGRRIIFPWRAGDFPPGEVQMDIVFTEELLDPPVRTRVPLSDGGGLTLWTASKPLSLAWKLLWLVGDSYPQGKDLYDAALLAEHTQLPYDLLDRVLKAGLEWPGAPFNAETVSNLQADWKNFQREYPFIAGTHDEWRARLDRALAPTFAGRDASQP